MKKIFEKHKKLIIILSFAYIYLLFVLLAPTNYIVLTPGELSSVNNNYLIEESTVNNNINTISVYSWSRVSVLQKWIAESSNRYELREKDSIDHSLSNSERNLQGKISLNSSHNNAIIQAYNYASKVDSNISINYKLVGFRVYESSNNNLKIGNLITKINNVTINTNSFEDYLTNLSLYDLAGNIIRNNNFNVLVDDKLINILDSEYIIYYPEYEIINTSPEYKIYKDRVNVGGPSGGMIQTLSIYSSLLNIEYNAKITGTGTINVDNDNSVGRIGGVKQKYVTAREARANVFIVPSSHYSEFAHLIKDKDKIEIILVKTFDDVINNFVNDSRWRK